jgi:hypothetical protein
VIFFSFLTKEGEDMSLFTTPDPQQDYAQPELRALLEKGIEPLKQWVNDLVPLQPKVGFHATTSWDDNVFACYLAKFLPKLPPTYYYLQDVIVIHLPHYWQNDCYNRIYTQRSGNCLIPDEFHQLLLDLTHAFGDRRLSVQDLAYWFEYGKTPEAAQQEEVLLRDDEVLHSVAEVETHFKGTVDLSTVHLLADFGTLEWMGLMRLSRHEHDIRVTIYVKGNLMLQFDGFQGEKMAAWFDEMRARGYMERRDR